MRICLISQEYPPETPWGGIGTQTWLKARGLARLGHEVHVLSRSAESGPDFRTATEDGVIVHRMQPPGFDFGVYERQAYWVGYSWHVFHHLQEMIEQKPFDVIDVADFGAESFCYQLDRNVYNFCPVVMYACGPLAMFTEHMGWPLRGSRLHEAGTFMERFCVQRADAICSCSHAIAKIVSEFYGIAQETIDTVHCGVDASSFSIEGRAEDSDRPTILYVGAMVDNKGPEIVIDSVLRLRSQYPDIRLILIGRDKPLTQRLKERVRNAGAEHNFEFLGFVPLTDLPKYYRSAWVFCSPAEFEGGTASVYLEAMACGCPLVLSSAGGGAEAVQDGENGLLVPPKDVEATATALDRIISDEPLRRRMGVAGRQRVDEYFAMDKFVERILKVYEKGIARGRALLTQMRKLEGLE